MSLERLRHEAGLTIRGLSDKSKVHYQKIYQIEHGTINIANITLRVASKLAGALACKPQDLLDDVLQNGGD
ncbi:MAG: helix-turn-helix transcriptional regulator [Oscillospiraceae bacterium]